MISEITLDNLFPTAQFFLHGTSAPYILDKNSKVDGILFYIWDDIPSRILNTKSNIDIEITSVETNFEKVNGF